MLEKVHFRNYEVTSFDFKEYKDSANGYFNVEFGELEIEFSKNVDDLFSYIIVTYSPELSGYEGDEPEEDDEQSKNDRILAFRVSASIRMSFEYDSEEELPEDYVEKNAWYFKNYVAISTRLAFESLLSGTALDSIKLPWSRPH